MNIRIKIIYKKYPCVGVHDDWQSGYLCDKAECSITLVIVNNIL